VILNSMIRIEGLLELSWSNKRCSRL